MLEAFFTKAFTIFREQAALAGVGASADTLFPLIEDRIVELDALVDTSTPAKYGEAISAMAKFYSQLKSGQLSVDEFRHTYHIPDDYVVDSNSYSLEIYQVVTMTGLFFQHKAPKLDESNELYEHYIDLHQLLEQQKNILHAIKVIRFGPGSVVRNLMRERLGVKRALSADERVTLQSYQAQLVDLTQEIDAKLAKIRPLEAALTEMLTAGEGVPAPAP